MIDVIVIVNGRSNILVKINVEISMKDNVGVITIRLQCSVGMMKVKKTLIRCGTTLIIKE